MSVESNNLNQAQKLLYQVSSCEVKSYFTYDFGRKHDSSGVSVVFNFERGLSIEQILEQVRQHLPNGLVAFIGTQEWLGLEEHQGQEIAVGPGTSQFDILRLARSAGTNYDISTEDIIEKLKKYDKLLGIDITHATSDTVVFKLLKLPIDIKAFAKDIASFCPDALAYGLEELASEIEKEHGVGLWWD